MASGLSSRTPVKLFRPDETEPYAELSGERFAGSLLHPVPRIDMDRQFGIDQRGCKVVARWNDTAKPIENGDLLGVDDQTYPICGVVSKPGFYVELFIREP
jgi:hypothetical protein